MRIVKVENPNQVSVATEFADYIADTLLCLRRLCSGYKAIVTTNTALLIYKELEKADKTYLFNVTNFDPNLLAQCRDILRRHSTKPAYIVYNHLERLESEQAMFLEKHLPVYPENQNLYTYQQIETLFHTYTNKKRKEKPFKWE